MYLMEIMKHGDKCYLVKRRIKEHNFHSKRGFELEMVKMWRDYLGVDHVLKMNDEFIFVETIQDVEWEDIP